MQQLKCLGDERAARPCAYCGGAPETRDHVPSRALLVEPYPENMPVVPACRRCNEGFSLDEEYVACLIECVLAGTTDPTVPHTQKIRRTLDHRPALAARLAAARRRSPEGTAFEIEAARVERVLLKLARGHAHHELNEPQYGPPSRFAYAPLLTLSEDAHSRFEAVPVVPFWPEVGSRAIQRVALGEDGWIEVQPGRYRFLATLDGGVRVRLVIAEYLAAEAYWTCS